jgi:hypothetical protein
MAKSEVNRTTVIGRIVHFVAEEDGHCSPAMIIGTHNSTEGTAVEVPEEGTVHLVVFDPDEEEFPSYRAWNVPHNVSGASETYHWQDACNGA